MTAIAQSAAARPQVARIGLVVIWSLGLSLLLALSARVSVPFWPVPMTLQTLAVLTIAGLAGPRIATAAMLAYLAEGAMGLPVFAGTPAHGLGLAYLAGPTGGYLVGMLAAAAVVGVLARRAAGRPLALVGAMTLGSVLVYAAGAAWLAAYVGVGRALALGVVPFLAGDAVKTALAVCTVLAAGRVRRA
ncbi:MAG TPA: biotin transporter BioY [Acetobacteraceae bacterium]|nr:biotin transporter BioY [Acetobacteraceae bacterium]